MKKIKDIEVNDPVVVSPGQGTIDLSGASPAELRAALEKSEAKEKAQKARAKKVYEAKKDKTVMTLSEEAVMLSEMLREFKERVHIDIEAQAVELAKYGDIRSNSKGGFQIKSNDDTFRIKRTRDTQPTWDERSIKAESLIREFLYDVVKKRAKKEFNILIALLGKNKEGQLDYQKVMILLSHEDNYSDPRWKEGLRLLRESYKVVLKGFGFYFEKKNKEGKWESIPMNFSSISL